MEKHIKHVIDDEMKIIQNNENLKRINNEKTDYQNKACVKPWGHEFILYENNKLAIWCLTIKKKQKTSLHCHFNKDTFIIVLKGSCEVSFIDKTVVELREMSYLFLPHYNFHSLSSFSPECVLLEIEVFNDNLNFSDKNDLLRIDDMYLRNKRGYEQSVQVLDKNNTNEISNYFSLYEGFNKIINDVKFNMFKCKNKTDLHKYQNDDHVILLNGKIFHDCNFLKEGSLINVFHDVQFPNDEILILSLKSESHSFNSKQIYDERHLEFVVNCLKKNDKKIILTSGCFDIMHVGHINLLFKSKKMGDVLIVCLSNDEQIKRLKGKDRPINDENDRLLMLKSFEFIDYVFLYDETDDENETSLGNIMKIVNPYKWTKGSDYLKTKIYEKHPYLNSIELIENVENKSTTKIVTKIKYQTT